MKRMIASFLTLVLLLTAIPETVTATASTGTPNYTMNGFTYTLDEKTESATILKYTGEDTVVTIPDSFGRYKVTTIGHRAFEGCSEITDIIFPDSLTTIYELAFSRCTSLKTVILPDSVTTISRAAFSGCTNLVSINFPKSWEVAGSLQQGGIFQDCPNLKTMVVPEGIEAIPSFAFSGFTSLEQITLPSTLKIIYTKAFSSCSSLKSIVIPEGVTEIQQEAFAYCDALTTVTLPDSLEIIATKAFQSCENLTSVFIGKNTEKINNNAFNNCPNLKIVSIENKDCVLENNVFKKSEQVTLICPLNSLTTTYAIDNDLTFTANSAEADTAGEVIDRSASLFQIATNSAQTNGYITFDLTYNIPETKWSDVKNPHVILKVPAGTKLDESTIFVDQTLCQDYKYNDDASTVSIDLENPAGNIRFSVKATESKDVRSYAILRHGSSFKPVREVIGIIDEAVQTFSIYTEDLTSAQKIQVNGVAPAGQTVEIYVDGVLKQTIASNKVGVYHTEIVLPIARDVQVFTLEARCANGQETLSKSCRVTYQKGTPALEGLHFYFNSESEKYIDLYTLNKEGVRPVVTFGNISKPMKFVVKMSNADNIAELYVTSTRNNIKKTLVAKYDAASDTFIAEGYFDEKSTNYVPGTIGVEYNLKPQENLLLQDGTLDILALENYVSQELKDHTEVVTVPTPSGVSTKYKFSDLSGEAIKDTVFDVGDAVLEAVLTGFDGETGIDYLSALDMGSTLNTIYSYIIPGQDGYDSLLTLDFSDPESIIVTTGNLIADGMEIKNTYQQIKLSGEIYDSLQNGTPYPVKMEDLANTLSFYTTAWNVISSSQQIYAEYNDLYQEIMMSDVYSKNPEKRKEALERAEELRKDKIALVLITTVLPALATGGASSAAGAVFTFLVSAMAASSDLFYEARIAQIKGGTFEMKWVIDPSGYVYDNVTEERLEGVTTTVYCIEYDNSDTFWDKVPAADTYGNLWNALEYSQQNPLITDEEGRYAWDVPEGWWRVKYEKDGYETIWSEWLPVPPPQTEVNIGMTPLKVPSTPEPVGTPDVTSVHKADNRGAKPKYK